MGQYTGRWTPPPDAIPQFSFDFREPLGPVEAPPNLPWLGPLPPWAGQDKPKVPTIGLKESLLDIGPRPDFNRRNFGTGEPIQRWTPPPDAIPQGQAPPEEPSFGRKIWNALDFPMADIRRRTPEVYEATERAAQPSVFHTPEEREQAIRFKKLNVGADILSGFTTPLNVGLGATSLAAQGTAKAAQALNAINPYRANQLLKLAGKLEAPGRAAAYGMAAGGIADIVDPESDTAERLGGIAETALGAYWGKRLTPKAKRTWAVGYERGVPAGYQGPAKQLPRFAGEGTPAEYRSGARFVGREGGGVYDREGGLVDLGPQEPSSPTETGIPYREEPVSPSTPIGQLKPVGRGSTVPETPRFDVGDVELQQAPDMSQEITLPLRTPQAPPPTGKITYQRIAGRNVKLIDGVPEDQAGERELVQEPNIQRTPENEALLRKFFNDESGTMDFDEMRRRFLAIRKGEPIGDVEKKGVAEFDPTVRIEQLFKKASQGDGLNDAEVAEFDRLREQYPDALKAPFPPPPTQNELDISRAGRKIEDHLDAINNETDPQKIKDNLDDLKRQMDNRDPNISTEESNAIIKLYLTASERFVQSQRKNLEPFTSKEQDMIRGMAGEPPKLKPIAGGRFGELPGKLKPVGEQEITTKIPDEVTHTPWKSRESDTPEIGKMRLELKGLQNKLNSDVKLTRQDATRYNDLYGKLTNFDKAAGMSEGGDDIQKMSAASDEKKALIRDLRTKTTEAIRRGDMKTAQALLNEREALEEQIRDLEDVVEKPGSKSDRDMLTAIFGRGDDPWVPKKGDPKEITRKRRELKSLEDKQRALIDEEPEGSEGEVLNEKDGARYDQLVDELNAFDKGDAEGGGLQKMARTAHGKLVIGSDIRSSAAELTGGYSSNIVKIMLREGGQNAFDAVKDLGMDGMVDVVVKEPIPNGTNKRPGSLTISDNGVGMSQDELFSVFSDLNRSGKRDDPTATGGKGVGKAPYILGGDHFEITTVKKIGNKKFQSHFSGKPEDMLISGTIEELNDPNVGIEVTTKEVPFDTPTGTTFTTTLKSSQNTYYVDSMLSDIMKWSRGKKAQITFQEDPAFGKSGPPEIRGWGDHPDDKMIIPDTDIDAFGTKADIILPGDTKLAPRQSVNVRVLNNGMYQYTSEIYLSESTNGIPGDVIVNVRPTVKEIDPNYPFPVQRESLKADVKAKVDKLIKEKLINPFADKKKQDLVKLWGQMKPEFKFPNQNRETVLFDSGDRLTPEERKLFESSKIISEMQRIIDVSIDDILTSVGRQELSDKLVRTGIILNREPGSRLYGIHIPNPTSPKAESAIFINPFEHALKHSNPADAALDVMTTMLHEVAHIGSGNDPDVFDPMRPTDLLDPRAGKYMQIYNQHVIEASGGDSGHMLPFVKRLGEIHARTGTKLGMAIVDAFEKIYTEGAQRGIFTQGQSGFGVYSPEFQNLLSIYEESRGRPATTEDIISGTGIKQSDSGSGGKRGIPGDSKSTGNRTSRRYGGFPREPKPTKVAAKEATRGKNQQAPITPETQDIRYPAGSIQRLKDALQAGKLLQPYKLQMQHLERSRRAGMIAGVQDPGLKGYFQKLGMLRGPLTPDIPIESKLTQHDLDALLAGITNSTLLPYSKLTAQGGLVKLFTGDIPTGSESRLLGKVFGEDLPKLIELHAGLGFAGQGTRGLVYGAVNVPKSLMSALDLSYTLRQAAPFMLTGEYWKSFQQMWKSFPDEEAFNGAMQAIYDDPVYEYFQQFSRPLFIGEFKKGSELALREEAFGSDIAARIPLMAGMGRMQTAFINKLRFDVAKRLLGDMYKSGYIDWAEGQSGLAHDQADKDVQRMLDFVNNFTGRGNLGAASRIAPFLNAAFFSPAFQMSRAHILASPFTYLNAPKAVRNEAWKSMFAIMSMIGIGIVLTKAMGGDVSDDPDDTDYGKGRFGNTRIDFSQGLQPIIVAGHRMASGRSKSPDKVDKSGRLIPGKEYDIGKTFTGPTIRSIIGNFFINKTSPIGGLINVWSQGEQAFAPGGVGGAVFPGREKGNMTKAAALNMVFPMVVSDMVDLYKEDPNISPRGLSFLLAAVLGLPVQTFETPKLKNPFDRGFQVPANPANQPQYQDQSPGMLIPPQGR